MYSFFIKSITICIFLINVLTGCSTGANGEFVMGNPGSPVWFGSASQETIIAHYKKACKSYGFPEGSLEMAGCVQKAISSGRDQSEKRKMNSLKILDDMDRRERESYQTAPSQSYRETCRQVGYFNRCRRTPLP